MYFLLNIYDISKFISLMSNDHQFNKNLLDNMAIKQYYCVFNNDEINNLFAVQGTDIMLYDFLRIVKNGKMIRYPNILEYYNNQLIHKITSVYQNGTFDINDIPKSTLKKSSKKVVVKYEDYWDGCLE